MALQDYRTADLCGLRAQELSDGRHHTAFGAPKARSIRFQGVIQGVCVCVVERGEVYKPLRIK